MFAILFVRGGHYSRWTKSAVHIRSYCTTNANRQTAKNGFSVVPIVLRECDLEEQYARGSGPGGQCVQKTSNKVQLTHVPSGLTVACHEFRDLTANRKRARSILKEKLDLHINGEHSKAARRIAKMKKRKSKRAQRAKSKYGKQEASGIAINDVQDATAQYESDEAESDQDEDDEENTTKS